MKPSHPNIPIYIFAFIKDRRLVAFSLLLAILILTGCQTAQQKPVDIW